MATSPEKRRAQMAAAAARYRQRKQAEAAGQPIPSGAENRRPPAPIVARAAARAAAMRNRRAETIEGLPNIRNLEGGEGLYVPRERPRAQPYKSTRGGQQRQAEAILEGEAALRLQAVGASRQQQLRDELEYGPNSAQLKRNMDPEQQARFQALSEAIARNSRQSLAILFKYAGGTSDYSSAYEQILASPESRDVEGALSKLVVLAGLARQASALYAPNALRLNGEKIGRLTV